MFRFWLDEVGVDFRTERGAESSCQCGEALNGLVVKKQVDGTEHSTPERDVREDGAHHRLDQVPGESAALHLLAVRRLVLGHLQNAISCAVKDAFVCRKGFRWRKGTLEVLLNDLPDVTRPVWSRVVRTMFGHTPKERHACRCP